MASSFYPPPKSRRFMSRKPQLFSRSMNLLSKLRLDFFLCRLLIQNSIGINWGIFVKFRTSLNWSAASKWPLAGLCGVEPAFRYLKRTYRRFEWFCVVLIHGDIETINDIPCMFRVVWKSAWFPLMSRFPQKITSEPRGESSFKEFAINFNCNVTWFNRFACP